MKKILQVNEAHMIDEEMKFDLDDAAKIVTGVENILAAMFSVIVQLLAT